MSHVRAQVREAAKALMLEGGGLATTGNRVEIGRTRNLPANHAPTLLIYVLPEEPETSSVLEQDDPDTLDRAFTLSIEGRVQQAEAPDDELDEIALEVETRVGAKQRFGGLVQEMTLIRTQHNVQAPGDRHIGGVRLDYRVRYVTAEGSPEESL